MVILCQPGDEIHQGESSSDLWSRFHLWKVNHRVLVMIAEKIKHRMLFLLWFCSFIERCVPMQCHLFLSIPVRAEWRVQWIKMIAIGNQKIFHPDCIDRPMYVVQYTIERYGSGNIDTVGEKSFALYVYTDPANIHAHMCIDPYFVLSCVHKPERMAQTYLPIEPERIFSIFKRFSRITFWWIPAW